MHTLDTANPIILSNNSGTAAYQGFEGSMTAVFVGDFSGDGWPDIITGSDGVAYSGTIGGRTRYWKNTGNAAESVRHELALLRDESSRPARPARRRAIQARPASSPRAAAPVRVRANLAVSPPQIGDFDMGLQLDYDHDPSNTLDMVYTNGNTASEFYIFPNRATPGDRRRLRHGRLGRARDAGGELTVSRRLHHAVVDHPGRNRDPVLPQQRRRDDLVARLHAAIDAATRRR